jgi:hypothetical protein
MTGLWQALCTAARRFSVENIRKQLETPQFPAAAWAGRLARVPQRRIGFEAAASIPLDVV